MSLIAYWKFNGNSNDASGNGLNGTDSNMTYVNKMIGQSASFNGSSSTTYVQNSLFGINGTAPFTYSFLFYINSYPTSGNYAQLCAIQQGTSGAINDKAIRIAGSGTTNNGLAFLAYDGAATKYALIPVSNLPTGVKHYITAVFDGSYLNVYKNGVFVTKTACSSTYAETTPRFVLSQLNTSGNSVHFNGFLDEFKVDNSAWSNAKLSNENSRLKGFF